MGYHRNTPRLFVWLWRHYRFPQQQQQQHGRSPFLKGQQQQQRWFFRALLPGTLKELHQAEGTGALLKHLAYQIPRALVILGILGCLAWVPYNRKRLVDGTQLYHAWVATQAAYADSPAAFVNRPEVRRHTDFLSVSHLDMHKGEVRLVLLETLSTMYLAVRGPLRGAAAVATRTNVVDEHDTTAADLTHAGLLRYLKGVPVQQVWEDTNMFDRHLVICGHGVGGACAHMLLLRELYLSHVSPTLHRIRSVSFSSPFWLHRKAREDVTTRGWRRMFTSVVLKADPYPSILSALLNPAVQNTPDPKGKAQLEQAKATLSELLAHPEDGSAKPTALEALEKQFLSQWKEVRKLLPSQEAEFAHFDPLGNYVFVDPDGGLPHPDPEYKSLPDTQMVVWKRGDLRQAFCDRNCIDDPRMEDGRRRSYTAALARLFRDASEPQANRRLPILSVNFPIYVHSRFL